MSVSNSQYLLSQKGRSPQKRLDFVVRAEGGVRCDYILQSSPSPSVIIRRLHSSGCKLQLSNYHPCDLHVFIAKRVKTVQDLELSDYFLIL